MLWIGQVWECEARGSWGDGRAVVVLEIKEDRIRVRNLDNGIRTWINRMYFDNLKNFAAPVDREFVPMDNTIEEHFRRLEAEGLQEGTIARRRRHVAPEEYERLMHMAKLPEDTKRRLLSLGIHIRQ